MMHLQLKQIFLTSWTDGAGMVVHLLLLKFSVTVLCEETHFSTFSRRRLLLFPPLFLLTNVGLFSAAAVAADGLKTLPRWWR